MNDLVYNEGYGRIYVVGCGDKNGMYGYIHSASMPDFYRFMQDPLIPIKPEYRKFFENRITPESNPVLFYYEYKK